MANIYEDQRVFIRAKHLEERGWRRHFGAHRVSRVNSETGSVILRSECRDVAGEVVFISGDEVDKVLWKADRQL